MVKIDLSKPNPGIGVEIEKVLGFLIVKFEFEIDGFHNGYASVAIPKGVTKIEVSAKE